MLCTFYFLPIFATFVRGEFVHGENFCGESAEKVFCAGFFLSPWFFCALRETFLGGGGGRGGVRGGGPGGPGGQNGQKRAKKGVFGGVRGGGPKWAVSVPEWYTSGSASTASHSTGWQKSPEYALIRIAAGPPFPGHFPPPRAPGQKSPVSGGPFWPTPTKARPSSSFLPQKSRRGLPASHLRRDHHNPWCTGVSSCTVQHICDVSHFCTHTGAETPVRATSTVHTARTPRTPRTHTPHTHPHPRAQHSALVAEVGGRCGASTRHYNITFILISTYLYVLLTFYCFLIFMLHALRYAKSHKQQRANGWGGARFHKGPRRSFVGLWGRL